MVCIHCGLRTCAGGAVWCKPCTQIGRALMREAQSQPWWTWTPYRLANVERYVTAVQRHLAKEPDPALVLPAQLTSINLPDQKPRFPTVSIAPPDNRRESRAETDP